MATKREYDAAKREYASWTPAQHADPTPEMLAVVAVINEYERAENDKLEGAHG